MSKQQFFPYRTAPSSISLSVDIYDPPIEPGNDGVFRVFDADIKAVKVRADIVLSTDYKEKVIAPAELKSPPTDMQLIIRSIDSRQRKVASLEGDGECFFSEFSLLKEEWVGHIEVQAILVRNTANGKLPSGHASDLGAKLAWSEPIVIMFDEPAAPLGNNLNVDWVKFQEDENLKQHSLGHLFHIDTQGQTPRLRLNEDVHGARSVLDSNATTGRKAAIRDATNHWISHQVWTSLLTTAITALADTKDDPPGSPPNIEGLTDEWKKTTLKDWASFLFPEFSAEDALEQLQDVVAEQSGVEDVIGRINRAIQNRFKTFNGFERLVMQLEINVDTSPSV